MSVPAALLFLFALSAAASPAVGAVNVQTQPDGKKYASVLVNGSTTLKYDIVFVGDGFTESEQATFNQRVDDAVAALETLLPYSIRMCGLNVWRVNVVSEESGVDHPKDGVFRDSELDCRYGDPSAGEAERCIRSDSPAKCVEAAGHAPAVDATFVLVNDTQWGGCAGGLVFSSISPAFSQIITHELGHKIAALADEYTCYVCDGSDDNDTYTGTEPSAVNVTTKTQVNQIKWNALITAGTPLPTTVDNPVGVVGLWEGGKYKAKGIYRPQAQCQMRNSAVPFCEVCENKMRQDLEGHCTRCELADTVFEKLVCANPGMLRQVELPWWARLGLRWPIPPCLTCPPFPAREEVTVVFDRLPEDGFEVQIVDAAGRVVARSAPSKGPTVQVSFDADPSAAYSVDLTTPEPTASTLEIVPRVLRNGVGAPLSW